MTIRIIVENDTTIRLDSMIRYRAPVTMPEASTPVATFFSQPTGATQGAEDGYGSDNDDRCAPDWVQLIETLNDNDIAYNETDPGRSLQMDISQFNSTPEMLETVFEGFDRAENDACVGERARQYIFVPVVAFQDLEQHKTLKSQRNDCLTQLRALQSSHEEANATRLDALQNQLNDMEQQIEGLYQSSEDLLNNHYTAAATTPAC